MKRIKCGFLGEMKTFENLREYRIEIISLGNYTKKGTPHGRERTKILNTYRKKRVLEM